MTALAGTAYPITAPNNLRVALISIPIASGATYTTGGVALPLPSNFAQQIDAAVIVGQAYATSGACNLNGYFNVATQKLVLAQNGTLAELSNSANLTALDTGTGIQVLAFEFTTTPS